ncbi:enhancer of polycomb homolog 1 [Dendroctonus ponderosae]|uniref:Enhancer of polycomb-like protein n=1 Tax=Dendroctonus ponderosae TaxID=77166 RepID=A0AAR5QFM2_DENPD|nr:enhancer of polycomb homolog 1 [Dendroctonus ponderosae]KAH1000864.1 hypothetical protein HUJ04_013144 [Dendroctonus ponderosae]KAH1006575.1 hypothetical protein HUJ05_007297 [Dendroctonus ponderosae]
MSKLSFRARALDPSKPMPIYMAEELPDLPDFSAINRAVPQMPTGMQKEEECEHHLQRAICAGLIIPTPEVTDVPLKDFYDKVYPPNYKQPRQLIHMQPFTMEQEIPDYDMDSDDERWLQSQKPRLELSHLKFEEMMDRLEKSSGQTVVTLGEAKALLKEDDELTIAVYDYWLNKRLKTQHPLILSVRTEHRSGQAANNPYLAFRRRTEKMQTRKNRKNDEVSYEKMLKLRRDLVRAVTMLELVKRREKCKREFVHLTVEVFEKRYQARDYNGSVAAEAAASKAALAPPRPAFTPIFHNHNQSWADAVATQAQAVVQHGHKTSIKDDMVSRREKRQYRKRKHKALGGRSGGLDGLSSDEDSLGGAPHRGASPDPEEQEDDGPYAFRRNRLCSYHKPMSRLGNWPWCSREENGAGDKRFRFTLTSLSNRKCVGFGRRRSGRGGRIILDRVSTDADDFWRGMDFSIIEPQENEISSMHSSIKEPLVGRLQGEPQSLRTENSTSTYNKYSAVSSEAHSDSKTDSGFPSISDFLSNSSSGTVLSDRLGSDIKVECSELRPEPPQQDEPDRSDIPEFPRILPRDWLHFRPKTPPPDYEPPCHMLPADELPFANVTLPSFQVEIESLESPSVVSVMLDQGPFVTDLFELDRRWSDESSYAKQGPQGSIFEDEDEEELENSWRTAGASSFTLKDAGGENIMRSESGGKVAGAFESCNEEQDVGSTNGLIPQLGFTADVHNLNRLHYNKLQPYNYNSTGTLSLLTAAQSVKLNSHSANNIIEYPLTAAVDVEMDSQSEQPGDVSNSPNQKTPNGGVRNNKSTLVMEVT